MKTFVRSGLLVLALTALLAAGAHAQLQTGNLYGTVKDQSDSALPGVTVTLSGQGAPQLQVTNAQGAFHFLGLSPGSYDIKAELEGFSTVDYPNIAINIGRNTSIEVKLQSAVEETITVTAESPLLDERRISTGATVAQTELEKIPTARDPWAILQTTPGVLTDRINVGGNQSGQQSSYVGPGSTGDQAVWAVDGVIITDMGIKAFNANQMDKAFGYFDQVVKDYPERSDAYYYRGLVYLNRGKHAEAKADFQKVLQLDPNGKFADDAKAFLKDIK